LFGLESIKDSEGGNALIECLVNRLKGKKYLEDLESAL